MNLALPALVILLGLLPGIACFYGYFSGRFEKTAVGVSGVGELALYVIFAIPLDAIALLICRWLGIPFNFEVATHLLAGNLSEESVREITTTFQESAIRTAWTYFIILLCSGAIGSLLRRLVWSCRLDTKIPHLRLKHSWFYILRGRVPGLPRVVLAYVDVMTRLPDKDSQTRLFRGLVVDFDISPNGAIESLTLKNAVRGSGRGDQFKWKHIPSTRLVLMGSTIHSINVTYFGIDKPDGAGSRFLTWLRSFLLEEP